MSICRARLRNTSNALTFRMSSEQIRLQVPSRLLLERANDQAVNSRLLVRRQKMHGSKKCCGELAELTLHKFTDIILNVRIISLKLRNQC